MRQYVTSDDALLSMDEEVVTCGRVISVREGGKYTFIVVEETIAKGMLECYMPARGGEKAIPSNSIVLVHGKVNHAVRSPAAAQVKVAKLYLLQSPTIASAPQSEVSKAKKNK
jgi:aspartyl/asparaginyl-tRNA synthetase